MYRSNDVCIVGRGGLFAGTWNSREFISSVFEGRCFVDDLRKAERAKFPWNIDLVFNADKKAEDQSYSPYGAYIDRQQLEKIVEQNGGDWSRLTTLESVSVEAAREALAPVRHLPKFNHAELILGLSTVDTEGSFAIVDKVVDEIHCLIDTHADALNAKKMHDVFHDYFSDCDLRRKPQMSFVVASHLTHELKKNFGLEGPATLVDAACASSLAAIHIALKRLRQHEADLVIAGGADVSVSAGCLVFFSRLGAMSDKINAPFDQTANGLSQGEGVGLFSLMRLKDALDLGLQIQAVIRACEGSSDGRSSAIVEPTAAGQRMAYQRAYTDAGLSEVDYIEAHGTGTKVGDKTEIESLSLQFPKKKIPIGTVKANIGHTIAAAGAAGLLKCLGILERKIVPPSFHFKAFPPDFKTHLFLNKKPLVLKTEGPMTIGQSSFGFGGSNFHLVLQEYVPTEPIVNMEPFKPSRVVICGSRAHAFTEFQDFAKPSAHRLPPNILPRIEKVQLMALQLVEQTFRELGIFPQYLDRDRVAVISSTMIPLDGYWAATRRVITSALRRYAIRKLPEPIFQIAIESVFEKIEAGSIPITEDTLSGFLNNIVAGRICNAFDFKGVSFNIDADLAGRAAAIRTGQTLLAGHHGMVVLIFCDEKIIPDEQRVVRTSLECMILANATYALEHDLPISQILNAVRYSERP